MIHATITIAFLAAVTLRSPELIPATIRIVALGDSTTAGTPAFRSPLEAPPDGRGDETSQYAYWLMKAHPEWDVVARVPSAVVIIAGVNDVYLGRASSGRRHRNATALYPRGANLRQILPVVRSF